MSCVAACLAAALVTSVHSSPVVTDADTSVLSSLVETDADTALTGPAKFIAGVSVYNYDKWLQTQQHLSVPTTGAVVDSSTEIGHWLVALKPGTSNAEVHDLCVRAESACIRKRHHHGFPFISLRATEEKLAAVVEHHASTVRFIEPVLPRSSRQGRVQRRVHAQELKSKNSSEMWGLDMIGAHNRATTGVGVHVYVVQGGVRTSHTDLGGRAFQFFDLFVDTNGTDLCSNSVDLACSEDTDSGQGTFCAGAIAGTNFGVAPDAKIWSVKVLKENFGTTEGIIAGILAVSTHGKRPAVIEMSIGGPGQSVAEKIAIDHISDEGITVVVSAGNEMRDACLHSPSFVPSAITVGGVRENFNLDWNSNWGWCIDIFAPGDRVEGIEGLPEYPKNDTLWMSGIAQAPYVAGAAALLLQDRPNLKPYEILAELRSKALVNYITDTSPYGEPNLVLYVGKDGPLPEKEKPKQTDWPTLDDYRNCMDDGEDGPWRAGYNVCVCAMRGDKNEGPNATMCYDTSTIPLIQGCPVTAAVDELTEARGKYYSWFTYKPSCRTCQCLTEAQVKDMNKSKEGSWNSEMFWIVGAIAAVLVILALVVYIWQQKSQTGRPITSGGDVEMPQQSSG